MDIESARDGMSRSAAWAIISVGFLLCPALASAQSSNGPYVSNSLTNLAAPKLTCVYKGIMTDAEIEVCTGHPVQYDYRVR